MKSKHYEVKNHEGQFKMSYAPAMGYIRLYDATYAPKIYTVREALKCLPNVEAVPDFDFSHPWRVSKTEDKEGGVLYELFVLYNRHIEFESRLFKLYLDSDKRLSELYAGPLLFFHAALDNSHAGRFTDNNVVCGELGDKKIKVDERRWSYKTRVSCCGLSVALLANK